MKKILATVWATSLFGLAVADVETYSQSASLTINRTGSFLTSAFTPNFIPKFDESGTRSLTNVSELFSTSASLTITGIWNAPSVQNQALRVDTTDSLAFANINPSFNDTLTRQANLVNGQFYSFQFNLGGGRTTVPSSFAPFLGNGPVAPAAVWSKTLTLSGFSGFNNLQISGNATATNRVDYNYEVVPEPGTLMLIGFGTAALACRKRKMRRPQ